jgi:hypothetical protein
LLRISFLAIESRVFFPCLPFFSGRSFVLLLFPIALFFAFLPVLFLVSALFLFRHSFRFCLFWFSSLAYYFRFVSLFVFFPSALGYFLLYSSLVHNPPAEDVIATPFTPRVDLLVACRALENRPIMITLLWAGRSRRVDLVADRTRSSTNMWLWVFAKKWWQGRQTMVVQMGEGFCASRWIRLHPSRKDDKCPQSTAIQNPAIGEYQSGTEFICNFPKNCCKYGVYPGVMVGMALWSDALIPVFINLDSRRFRYFG